MKQATDMTSHRAGEPTMNGNEGITSAGDETIDGAERLPALGGRPYVLVPERVLAAGEFVTGTAVAVTGGKIASVGPVDQVLAEHPVADVVALPGRAVLPGFVDAHHHLSQSFGGPLAFGEPSEIFKRVWMPLEAALTEEELEVSAQLAACESLRGGFTTVVDAGTRSSHDVAVMARATTGAGLRCVLPIVCNDSGVEDGERRAILGRAERHLARWQGSDLVHPSLAISIPEAATESTLVAMARLCGEAGVMLQTHLNEHLAGVERSLLTRGERPAEFLARIGVLGESLLAAHATMLTASEMRLFADTGAAISYNPVASSWKGNAIAPAMMLAELGVRMGLGTDGTRGDGFRLLDAAETAQRFAGSMGIGDAAAGRGRLWLDLATRGGADAAGLGAVTGRIEEGLAADLLVVRTDVPELTPSWDLVWELVRLGNRDLIEAVVVGGTTSMVDGEPVGSSRAELQQRAAELAELAVVRAGLRPPCRTPDPALVGAGSLTGAGVVHR